MKKVGKFLGFIVIIICLGFVGLMAREGKFSSVWSNVQGLFSGKKEHKLTFKDYDFKQLSERMFFRKC